MDRNIYRQLHEYATARAQNMNEQAMAEARNWNNLHPDRLQYPRLVSPEDIMEETK